jgi:hypothetical protein
MREVSAPSLKGVVARNMQLCQPKHFPDLPAQRDDLDRLLQPRLGINLLPNPDDLLERKSNELDLALQQSTIFRNCQPCQFRQVDCAAMTGAKKSDVVHDIY